MQSVGHASEHFTAMGGQVGIVNLQIPTWNCIWQFNQLLGMDMKGLDMIILDLTLHDHAISGKILS